MCWYEAQHMISKIQICCWCDGGMMRIILHTRISPLTPSKYVYCSTYLREMKGLVIQLASGL